MFTIEEFNLYVWIWIGLALLILPLEFFITAPYGRHTKRSWGPMINNRLGWILMELPALLVFVWMIIRFGGIDNIIVKVAIGLWLIHYIHRSLIFPFRINTKNKKMPILIMLFAIVFNFVNGFINGYWLGNFADYPIDWIYDIRFILGSLLFVFGFIVNQFHDRILIKLRKNSTNGYQIPFGGFFKYVSCPNFLGEIIEWAGFTILVWNLPVLAFFIWTAINLVPRALDHHKWYKKNFSDYPDKRHAIIPFIL